MAELFQPYRSRPRLKKWPGEGIAEPDRYGHFYRGLKPGLKRLFADYARAQYYLVKAKKLAEVKFLNSLWGTRPGSDIPRTPLQRIAYGFLTHCWDAVRAAALDLQNQAGEAKTSPGKVSLKVDDIARQIERVNDKKAKEGSEE